MRRVIVGIGEAARPIFTSASDAVVGMVVHVALDGARIVGKPVHQTERDFRFPRRNGARLLIRGRYSTLWTAPDVVVAVGPMTTQVGRRRGCSRRGGRCGMASVLVVSVCFLLRRRDVQRMSDILQTTIRNVNKLFYPACGDVYGDCRPYGDSHLQQNPTIKSTRGHNPFG